MGTRKFFIFILIRSKNYIKNIKEKSGLQPLAGKFGLGYLGFFDLLIDVLEIRIAKKIYDRNIFQKLKFYLRRFAFRLEHTVPIAKTYCLLGSRTG